MVKFIVSILGDTIYELSVPSFLPTLVIHVVIAPRDAGDVGVGVTYASVHIGRMATP